MRVSCLHEFVILVIAIHVPGVQLRIESNKSKSQNAYRRYHQIPILTLNKSDVLKGLSKWPLVLVWAGVSHSNSGMPIILLIWVQSIRHPRLKKWFLGTLLCAIGRGSFVYPEANQNPICFLGKFQTGTNSHFCELLKAFRIGPRGSQRNTVELSRMLKIKSQDELTQTWRDHFFWNLIYKLNGKNGECYRLGYNANQDCRPIDLGMTN